MAWNVVSTESDPGYICICTGIGQTMPDVCIWYAWDSPSLVLNFPHYSHICEEESDAATCGGYPVLRLWICGLSSHGDTGGSSEAIT